MGGGGGGGCDCIRRRGCPGTGRVGIGGPSHGGGSTGRGGRAGDSDRDCGGGSSVGGGSLGRGGRSGDADRYSIGCGGDGDRDRTPSSRRRWLQSTAYRSNAIYASKQVLGRRKGPVSIAATTMAQQPMQHTDVPTRLQKADRGEHDDAIEIARR
jgi:hypothetical protein